MAHVYMYKSTYLLCCSSMRFQVDGLFVRHVAHGMLGGLSAQVTSRRLEDGDVPKGNLNVECGREGGAR